MSFSQQQEQTVIKALGEKLANNCPACDKAQRELMPDLMLFLLQSTPPRGTIHTGARTTTITMPPPGTVSMSPSLPCVVVICGNCGFTEFYNVHRLGVAAALGVPEPGVAIG
jgi:hypothetical protein